MSKDLQIYTDDEITLVNSGLETKQIQEFFTKTPDDKIKTRPAKGGGEWSFVSGSYVTQVLNKVFGFNWDFTITTSMEEALKTAATGTIVVQGKLRVKIGNEWITKEQYGRKEVAYRSEWNPELKKKVPTSDLLDFGNDMKAAATDAKKKCASELGLFADVYSQEDFVEAEVITQDEKEQRKVEEVSKSIEKLNATKNTESLRQTFVSLGTLMSNPEVIKVKDAKKKEFENEDTANKSK